MSAKSPRLSVVLSPSLAATLAALSKATGDSASSLVRGLLEQTEPALQRMLQLVIAAEAAKGSIGAGVGLSLGRVVNELEEAVAIADSRTGRVLRDLVAQAEVVPGRRRRAGAGGARTTAAAAAAGGSTPVAVTRGSGTGKTRSKGPAGGSV